jgi:hypothetical protein
MKRWASNIFCMLSLLVFVSGMAVWVRSYLVEDDIQRWIVQTDPPAQSVRTRRLTYSLAWSRGTIYIARSQSNLEGEWPGPTGWFFGHAKPTGVSILASSPNDRANFQLGGFQWVDEFVAQAEGWRSAQRLSAPLWLFLPAGIPPWMWWRRWRRSGGRGFAVQVAGSADKGSP